MEQPTIRILPEHVANQIAAGEVVQRPESVVKELVENALDAGATDIAVLIRQGGKALVHVIDNGCGMSRADLELALKRHATSKIATLDDLQRLATLGFRGEALASIASVAEVEILTRRPSDEHGWRLISQPLKGERIEPAECPAGTQVIVRDLFFNVPARRKFLRSDVTETRYIAETMIRYGLSYHHVGWMFHDGSAVVFQVSPQSLLERIETLLRPEVAGSMIPVEYATDHVRIEGYIGLPSIARTTRAGQYLFLNRRPIVSRTLTHAIYQGYEHLLDSAEHPLFVLFLWIDPQHVDVNVHPQKHEVKFDDERAIYHALHTAVLQSLREHNLIPQLRLQQAEAAAPLVQIPAAERAAPLVVNRLTGEIIESHAAEPRRPASSMVPSANIARTTQVQWHGGARAQLRSLLEPPQQQAPSQPVQETFAALPAPRMWQVHNKYIFVQTDDGLIIIDQHVAHERILYERALAALESAAANRSQRLMFPVEVELSAAEVALYRQLESKLQQLGYDCALVEERAVVVVRAVPAEVRAGSEAASLRELLEQYAETQAVGPTSVQEALAASFACRAAIKAGDPLSLQQMQELVDQLFRTTNPSVCPHGRPVMVHLPLRELDYRFGRTS